MAVRLILFLLGAVLAIAGAALMADTITGSRVFDQARLADLWPPALVLVGLITIADAVTLRAADPVTDRSPGPDEHVPSIGTAASRAPMHPPVAMPVMAAMPVTSGTSRPGDEDLPIMPTSEAAAARAQETHRSEPETVNDRDLPEDEPLAAGAEVRPAPDALAVLLELQALRRNRLISRKQYRAKRRAVVAGIAPRFVGSPWPDAGTGGSPVDAGSARPLAYWGPTAE